MSVCIRKLFVSLSFFLLIISFSPAGFSETLHIDPKSYKDKKQSFKVNFKYFPDTEFASYYKKGKWHKYVSFYLLKNGKAFARLPDHHGSKKFLFDKISAVSFKDINGDGLKDIIILAQYMSDRGPEAMKSFPAADIYFQTKSGFVKKAVVTEALSGSPKRFKTIADVLSFTKINSAFVTKVKYLISHLDKTRNQGKGFDYWPEGGMQIAYYHFATFITYQDIVKYSPVSVFKSGPHSNSKLNLIAPLSFGKYNHDFVNWVAIQLDYILSDQGFINKTKPLFDKYLSSTLLVYWESITELDALGNKKYEIIKDYTGKISKGNLPGDYYYQIPFGKETEFSSAIKAYNSNINTSGPAFLFWIRRDIDSTDRQIKRMLKQLLLAYKKI